MQTVKLYSLVLLSSAWLAPVTGAVDLAGPTGGQVTQSSKPLYTFTLAHDGTQASYDEALAVASLQGIINRQSPELYLLSRRNTRPQFWLDLLAKDGRWLQGRERQPLADLDALIRLAGDRLKGAVIWDPGNSISPTANA